MHTSLWIMVDVWKKAYLFRRAESKKERSIFSSFDLNFLLCPILHKEDFHCLKKLTCPGRRQVANYFAFIFPDILEDVAVLFEWLLGLYAFLFLWK